MRLLNETDEVRVATRFYELGNGVFVNEINGMCIVMCLYSLCNEVIE